MSLHPTIEDKIVDKLIAISMWADKARDAISVKTVLLRAIVEIHRLSEELMRLRELVRRDYET